MKKQNRKLNLGKKIITNLSTAEMTQNEGGGRSRKCYHTLRQGTCGRCTYSCYTVCW